MERVINLTRLSIAFLIFIKTKTESDVKTTLDVWDVWMQMPNYISELSVMPTYDEHPPEKDDRLSFPKKFIKKCTPMVYDDDTRDEIDFRTDLQRESDASFLNQMFLQIIQRILIHPGTRWCGIGNSSQSPEDLGYFEDTDKCCREHDYCSDYLMPGEELGGLENTGWFTKLHCKCDEQFRQCLKKVNCLISREIGFTYFSIYGPRCYKLEYPIIDCERNIEGRCVRYELDWKGQKRLQWFDNPMW